MRTIVNLLVTLAFVFAAIVGVGYFLDHNPELLKPREPEFGLRDMAHILTAIPKEISQRNPDVQATVVNFDHKSPRELVVFLKLRRMSTGTETTQQCIVTIADDDKSYSWKCG